MKNTFREFSKRILESRPQNFAPLTLSRIGNKKSTPRGAFLLQALAKRKIL